MDVGNKSDNRAFSLGVEVEKTKLGTKLAFSTACSVKQLKQKLVVSFLSLKSFKSGPDNFLKLISQVEVESVGNKQASRASDQRGPLVRNVSAAPG